ncbi:hypothetical protein PVAG01_02673 [Phlyctema vagabunda]|uniref:Uncharacterized protein n=1 Tax=Phlyctema vagabunda TaxID=108571 RepID=A0ABR4PRA9_9HELO
MDSSWATTPTELAKDAPNTTPCRRKSLRSLFGSLKARRHSNTRTTEFDFTTTSPQSPQTPTRKKSTWSLFGSIRHRTIEFPPETRNLENCPIAACTSAHPVYENAPEVRRRKSLADVFENISPRRSIRRRLSKATNLPQIHVEHRKHDSVNGQYSEFPTPPRNYIDGSIITNTGPSVFDRQLDSSDKCDDSEENADIWGFKMERRLYEFKLRQADIIAQQDQDRSVESCKSSDPPCVFNTEQDAGPSNLFNSTPMPRSSVRQKDTTLDLADTFVDPGFSDHDEISIESSGTTLFEAGYDSDVHIELDKPQAQSQGTRTPDSYLQGLITAYSDQEMATEISHDPLSRLRRGQGDIGSHFSKFSESPSPEKRKPALPTDFLKDVSPVMLDRSRDCLATAHTPEIPAESSNPANSKISHNSVFATRPRNVALLDSLGSESLAPTNYQNAFLMPFGLDTSEVKRMMELGAQVTSHARSNRINRPSIYSSEVENTNTGIKLFQDSILEQSLALRDLDTAQPNVPTLDEVEGSSNLEHMSQISFLAVDGSAESWYSGNEDKAFEVRQRRPSLNSIPVVLPPTSVGTMQSKFYAPIIAARENLLRDSEAKALDQWEYDVEKRAFRIRRASDATRPATTNYQDLWSVLKLAMDQDNSDTCSEPDSGFAYNKDHFETQLDSKEVYQEECLNKANEEAAGPYEADDEDEMSDFFYESDENLSNLGSELPDSRKWHFESAQRYRFNDRELREAAPNEVVLLTLEDADLSPDPIGPTRIWFNLGDRHNKQKAVTSGPEEGKICCSSTAPEITNDNGTDTASDPENDRMDAGGNGRDFYEETGLRSSLSRKSGGKLTLWKRRSASQLRNKYMIYRRYGKKTSSPGIDASTQRNSESYRAATRPGGPTSLSLPASQMSQKRKDPGRLMAGRSSNGYIYGRRESSTSDSFYARLDPEEAEMNREIATRLPQTPKKVIERVLTPEFDESYANMDVPLSHISSWNFDNTNSLEAFRYWRGTKGKYHRSISPASSSGSSLEFPRYNTFVDLLAEGQDLDHKAQQEITPTPAPSMDNLFWDRNVKEENESRFGTGSNDEDMDYDQASYMSDTVEVPTVLDLDPSYGFPRYDRYVSESESSILSVNTDTAEGAIKSEVPPYVSKTCGCQQGRRARFANNCENHHIFSEESEFLSGDDRGFENSLALREIINAPTSTAIEKVPKHLEFFRVTKNIDGSVTLRDLNLRPVGRLLRQSRLPVHKSVPKAPVSAPQPCSKKPHHSKPGILRGPAFILPLTNKKNLPLRSPRLMTPSGRIYMPADECKPRVPVSEAETDESSDFGEPLKKVENHHQARVDKAGVRLMI